MKEKDKTVFVKEQEVAKIILPSVDFCAARFISGITIQTLQKQAREMVHIPIRTQDLVRIKGVEPVIGLLLEKPELLERLVEDHRELVEELATLSPGIRIGELRMTMRDYSGLVTRLTVNLLRFFNRLRERKVRSLNFYYQGREETLVIGEDPSFLSLLAYRMALNQAVVDQWSSRRENVPPDGSELALRGAVVVRYF